ncbi:GvpL/GvpF family gas vesicle protein [Streptomyces sp. NPDC058052]|uniref:GvpL/GvpF family gas vesicle protein n=1 Tax=Streptomyces sp. NPDC058052 TaxID=3346316 RepID=UPI0036E5FC49
MTSPGEHVVYVYAVTVATAPLRDRLAALRGVGGAPVELLSDSGGGVQEGSPGAGPGASGGGAAGGGTGPADGSGESGRPALVVSAVPRVDFDEAALTRHFEDLAWLERVARAHHDVVGAVAAVGTVLPLRMATVYEDGDRAGRALAERQNTFARRLTALRAHAEYGVKLSVPPAATGADEPAPADPDAGTAASAGSAEGDPPGPGRAYLHRRRAQRRARETVHAQARHAASALAEAAALHASEHVRHAPQRSPLSGPYENVLNDSYLVADERVDAFRAAVSQVADRFPTLRVDVTGPWAPYSFAMPPAPDPDPDDGSAASGPPAARGRP